MNGLGSQENKETILLPPHITNMSLDNLATMSSHSASDADPSSHSILKHRLEEFLQKRQPPKTFCPSEVARALTAAEMSDLGFDTWRDAMPAIRQLAWELMAAGECEVLQKGECVGEDVTAESVKGPVRIRRVDR